MIGIVNIKIGVDKKLKIKKLEMIKEYIKHIFCVLDQSKDMHQYSKRNCF